MELIVYVSIYVLAAYSLVGLVFAIFFVSKGVGKIDSAALGTSLWFKVVIIPGTVIFWPFFSYLLLSGKNSPLVETNSHRRMSLK